jgi:hypothetical protein
MWSATVGLLLPPIPIPRSSFPSASEFSTATCGMEYVYTPAEMS